MTFIIAVQLKDSIIVAIDNKHLILKKKIRSIPKSITAQNYMHGTVEL